MKIFASEVLLCENKNIQGQNIKSSEYCTWDRSHLDLMLLILSIEAVYLGDLRSFCVHAQ